MAWVSKMRVSSTAPTDLRVDWSKKRCLDWNKKVTRQLVTTTLHVQQAFSSSPDKMRWLTGIDGRRATSIGIGTLQFCRRWHCQIS